MSLTNIKGKKILLLGKPRAFDMNEFLIQLNENSIAIVPDYTDEVSFIIEGRLMTPYEQNEFEKFYEIGLKNKFCTIDELEKFLIQNIDANVLQMSLKLSRDEDRLLSYIKNTQINDQLFLKLIGLYDWHNEGFFDDDENRDVTAALISRFYENIERNHNVQYATLGLMHLVEQSKNEQLIEVIASLQPLKKGFDNPNLYPILLSLARSSVANDAVLKMLLKNGTYEIHKLIALREDLSKNLQSMLLLLKNEEIRELLCQNKNLDRELVPKLQFDHADTIARNISLTQEIFEEFLCSHSKNLALNSSLTKDMQQTLLHIRDNSLTKNLCTNITLDKDIAEEIYNFGEDLFIEILLAYQPLKKEHFFEAYVNEQFHLSLAKNPKTPVELLEKLSLKNSFEILKALSQNPSTPVTVLYELRLDRKLERLVSENENFTNHIKSENIGWLE